MSAESIYHASPIWAQQLMVAGWGYWWHRRRYGSHFDRFVKDFRTRENWTAEQFRSYQTERLKEVLAAAWHSPYYRQLFDEFGVTPETPPFEALSLLPTLSKETLRTRGKELLTKTTGPRGTLVLRSSGTTGTPTEIYYTSAFHSNLLAVAAARSLGWANIDHRAKRLMLGVRKVCAFEQDKPPFWRFSPAENMAYASIYHLSPKFLPSYLRFMRSYKPEILMGSPSALHTIARYALENNDLPPRARGVFTTSETVTPQNREAIERAWQCRLYDRYGAVEGSLFASQCEFSRYHVSPEAGIVEIVDESGTPLPPGSIGEVVCTGLQNTLQPLIRYRIGDATQWAVDQSCPCGRQMPILETVEGRVEDMCYTADGRQMLRFGSVFKDVEHIREAQIVQDKLDHFTIQVVPAAGFNADDSERVRRNMRMHVGNTHIDVKLVAAIPRSASGKFRAVICNLPAEERNVYRVMETGPR